MSDFKKLIANDAADEYRLASSKLYSGKSTQQSKVVDKYMNAIKDINNAYDNVNYSINKAYTGYKNQASAQAAISKSNINHSLSQKGLSKSGESLQNQLFGDMVLQNNLTNLSSEESNRISQSDTNRSTAIAQAKNDWAKEVTKSEMFDTQMDYQKERDEEDDQKWKAEFGYSKSRDTESDRKWQTEYEYGASRDIENDRKWSQEFNDKVRQNGLNYNLDVRKQDTSEKYFERNANREDEEFAFEKAIAQDDMHIKSAYLDIALKKQDYDIQSADNEYDLRKQAMSDKKASDSRNYNLSVQNQKNKKGDDKYSMSVDKNTGYLVPDLSPDKLIENIITASNSGDWKGSTFITKDTFKRRINTILNNSDIDPDYREILRIYAKARGILD